MVADWVRVAKRNPKSLAAACWPVCALLIGLAWIATGGDFGKWFWVALLLTTVFGALNLWLLAQLTGTPMSLWSVPSALAWSCFLVLITLVVKSINVEHPHDHPGLGLLLISGLVGAPAGLLMLFHFVPHRSTRSKWLLVVLLTLLIWGVLLPLAEYSSIVLSYIFGTPLADRIGGIWPAPLLIGLIWYGIGLINAKVYSLLSPTRGME